MFKDGIEYDVKRHRSPSISYQGKSAMHWAKVLNDEILNVSNRSQKQLTHMVRQHIKKYGHLEHLKKHLEKTKDTDYQRLYKGKKIIYWAKHYNVAPHTIRRHLKRFGNLNKINKRVELWRIAKLQKQLQKEERCIEIMRGEA